MDTFSTTRTGAGCNAKKRTCVIISWRTVLSHLLSIHHEINSAIRTVLERALNFLCESPVLQNLKAHERNWHFSTLLCGSSSRLIR